MRIAIPDDYQDAVRTLDCFQKLNGQHVVITCEHLSDPEVLAARLQGVEALVLIRERTPITEALLARLPDLRLIVQTGKRAPHIDLVACTRHGVAVVYTTPPDTGRPYATAELTWGLILAAMPFIPQEVASMKAGHWQRTLGRALHDRTLGIFGYGHIGSLVATYGRAFGMWVLAWGREGSLARAQADSIEAAASRDALFRAADVLSLHLVLTEETRSIVSAGDLAKMKLSALFVNTSRAALVEPGALVEALRAGRPGYVEKDSYESLFGAAFDQLLAFAAGDRTKVANPEALKGV